MKNIPILIAMILSVSILFLSGCASNRLGSSIVSFSDGRPLKGTIKIVPGKDISESLEFENYANEAYAALSSKGLTKACSANADYLGILSYKIDSGRTEINSTPFFGQTSGGTTSTTGNVGGTTFTANSYTAPTFGVTGSMTSSQVMYTRTLDFVIKDRKSGKNTWEGKERSVGTTAEMHIFVPKMIQLLFFEFPGQPCVNRYYTIDINSSKINKFSEAP